MVDFSKLVYFSRFRWHEFWLGSKRGVFQDY